MSGVTALTPTNEHRGKRLFRALLGLFAGVTVGWIVSAAFIAGDSVAIAEPRAIFWVGLGALLGAFAGFHVRAHWQHVLMVILVALSAAFWVFAPSGWWATEPPAGRDSVSEPR